ncbi:uncharacterized protein LOC119075455 [Bradysia coprophila]|uniref:uncharacterized protein LOC119075455 n=1 Tax=Bradysia coprophila TaxID=38358 RepID=UPI00187D99F9|nr:uncharacterized protein LOC119075455 [Bradysia coprophila]
MEMIPISSILECTGEAPVENNRPIKSTNITGTQITDMNDDCLVYIFSSQSLDLLDLCSIAETCTRFQLITELIFPKKLALERNGPYVVDAEKYFGQHLEEHDVKRVLTNFGFVVSDFSISERISRCKRERDSLDCVFMDAVTRHHFDSLKSLHIYGFKLPDICTDQFKEMFKRLQLLELQWVSTSDATLFDGLHSLVDLRVMQVENCGAILEKVFPALERFTYFTTHLRHTITIRRTKLVQSFDKLMTFVARHHDLKVIDLCFYSDNKSFIILLETIGNSCKNLVELWIRVVLSTFTSAHLKSLHAFKSLRTLGLFEVSCGNFQFISALTELRELHLSGCSLPGDFDVLSGLTKLVIDGCTTSDRFDLIQMIGRLGKLEELTISYFHIQSTKFQLSRNAFDQIGTIVMDRPQVLTLKCEFYFDLASPDMYSKILLLYYVAN